MDGLGHLARFAEALLPLLSDDQEQAVALAVEALGRFRPAYNAAWSAGVRRFDASVGGIGGIGGQGSPVSGWHGW